MNVELASNLVWVIVSLVALATTLWSIRRGKVRIPVGPALLAVVMICFLLLPVISISDDILEARQAALPLSGQTWHMASEGASVGLELVSHLGICLLLLAYQEEQAQQSPALDWVDPRHMADWLTRSQRLRPPPVRTR